MPKGKAVASLSGLIDTDMEDDTLNANAFPTPESNQENPAPAKKKAGRGKATAKRFTKAKTSLRRVSGEPIVPQKAVTKRKATNPRAPLKEQTNSQQAEDTEEVDEFDGQQKNDVLAAEESIEPEQPVKRRGRAKKAPMQAKKVPVQQAVTTEKDGEFEYTPTVNRQDKGIRPGVSAETQLPSKRKASVEPQQHDKVIPETQVPMNVDGSEPLEDEEDDEAIPQSVFRKNDNARASIRQQQHTLARKQVASLSDTDRGANDPATRRKVGDLTKKLESLETKYRNLREVGIKEAEANFEKLKSHSEAKAKGESDRSLYICRVNRSSAAKDLIDSLRNELATQKALTQDSRSLQNQIASRDADLTKTQALADQLSSSLAEAQNENKALQAKLASSRSASTAVESLGSKTPGSVIRGKAPAARTIMVGSAEAAQAAQVAQLKEDLYSDLTGLIVRGVERKEESDVYDCIQTGRNGGKLISMTFYGSSWFLTHPTFSATFQAWNSKGQ